MIPLRVHNDAATVQHLKTIAEQLPTGAKVKITLDDGQSFIGEVRSKPLVETGSDADGNQGQYAILTLVDAQPLLVAYLDRIVRVEQPA